MSNVKITELPEAEGLEGLYTVASKSGDKSYKVKVTDIGGGSDNTFIATFEDTPYTDVLEAYEDGKMLYAKYGLLQIPLTWVEDDFFGFSMYYNDDGGNTLIRLKISRRDGWEDAFDSPVTEVIDNLESYDNNAALSANQGRLLDSSKLDKPSTAGTSGQVLTSDGAGGQTWANIQKKVFVATYNETGLEDILAAVDAGKAVLTIKDGCVFQLSSLSYDPVEPEYAYANFTSLDHSPGASPQSASLYVDESGWQEGLIESLVVDDGTVLRQDDIANNVTTTDEGKVLDARQGKVLNSSKLDKPSIAGTAGQVLTCDGQGGQTWANAAGGKFEVEYGVTQYSEITTAVAAGKMCVCHYLDRTFYLGNMQNDYYFFFCMELASNRWLRLSATNAWIDSVTTMEQSQYKATSLANPDNTHYPTTGAVANALEGKADATEEATTQPAGGFLPNTLYKLGTLTGSVTFALAAAIAGQYSEYMIDFIAGTPAPTITWPAGISWMGGSAPTITAGKHYQVSILNNLAISAEF